MTDIITQARADAAEGKKLADLATPAPWRTNTIDNFGEDWPVGSILTTGAAEDDNITQIVTTDRIHASEMISGSAKDDAAFIAAARELVPVLAVHVTALADEVGETSDCLARETARAIAATARAERLAAVIALVKRGSLFGWPQDLRDALAALQPGDIE